MYYESGRIAVSTEHSASHYGIPVVLVDGREVSGDNEFGPGLTYGRLVANHRYAWPVDVRAAVTAWLAQWPGLDGIEPALAS